jgi:hypothetical protein
MQTRAPSFVDLLFRPAAGKVKRSPYRAPAGARRGRALDAQPTDTAPETGERENPSGQATARATPLTDNNKYCGLPFLKKPFLGCA